MTKNNKRDTLTMLEMSIDSACLGLAFAVASAAMAPVLPQDWKASLAKNTHVDLDQVHENVMQTIAPAIEFINNIFGAAQDDALITPYEPAHTIRPRKCTEKTIVIGGYEFTLPQHDCR